MLYRWHCTLRSTRRGDSERTNGVPGFSGIVWLKSTDSGAAANYSRSHDSGTAHEPSLLFPWPLAEVTWHQVPDERHQQSGEETPELYPTKREALMWAKEESTRSRQCKLQALDYILLPTTAIVHTPQVSKNCQLTNSFSMMLKRQQVCNKQLKLYEIFLL